MASMDADHYTTTPPPRYLFVQPNLTCNLRCQHCQMWRITDPNRMADRMAPLRLQAVHEFAELNPHGTVVTSGGEPLMEPSHYFNLCQTARDLGLHSISVMNGTLIGTQTQANDLLTRGADLIALSLDHPNEEIHDQMRGERVLGGRPRNACVCSSTPGNDWDCPGNST